MDMKYNDKGAKKAGWFKRTLTM